MLRNIQVWLLNITKSGTERFKVKLIMQKDTE